MTTTSLNNTRLGIFVSAGLLILVVALYTIGKNHSMFGKSFHLRARFKNVNGLMVGNNVRFSGIQAGTVSKIAMIDDTTIEVDILIDREMKTYIHVNAWASIGSEGLMGNKVINISPARQPSPEIAEGALLNTKKVADTDDMLATLSASNENVLVISENLKTALLRINNSKALWSLTNDTVLVQNIQTSLSNVRDASAEIKDFSRAMTTMIEDVKKGEGVAGVLLKDEHAATELRTAISHISKIAVEANGLVSNTDSMIRQIRYNIDNGPGVAHTVFGDTAANNKLNASVRNIQNGTAAFNENMEALKHNFLMRGYFRKKAKKDKQKATAKQTHRQILGN